MLVKRRFWLFASIIVLLCIVVFMGYSFLNQASFDTLAQRTSVYYTHQAHALGIQTSSDQLVKYCWRDSQSAFNTGSRLVCGIKVERTLPVQPDLAYIGNVFDAFNTSIRQDGFKIIDNINVNPNGAVISGQNDSHGSCTSRLDYSPTTAHANAKTTVDLAIACFQPTLKVPAGYKYRNAF